MDWTNKEDELVQKYFKTNISELTLYQQLYKINPKRTFKSISRRLEDMRLKQGYQKPKEAALKKLRVGYLDIEANNLNADFGFIISWCIKEKNKNYYLADSITTREVWDCKFDENVVHNLLTAMRQFDVLYAHYGSDKRFDFPFIRTRALKHGLEGELPRRNTVFIMDTYPIARNKLKLHSNRLDSIAEHLGIKLQKTKLSADIWQRAAVGDQKAIAYVVDHNKKDVRLLEMIHKRLEKIENPVYTSI